MESNNSPYIYEKPLRAKRSKRSRILAAVGLVSLGTIIGGSAFASSVINEAVADTGNSMGDSATTATNASPVEAVANLSNSDSSVSSLTAQSTQGMPVKSIITVPLEQAKPNKNAAAIQLPVLPDTLFGNTSSATPTFGGGTSSGTNLPSAEHSYQELKQYENQNETEDQDED